MATLGEFVECEVFIIVDADGNYAAGANPDQMAEYYKDDIDNDDATPKRIVRVVVKVPCPLVLSAIVIAPAETGEIDIVATSVN